uniref:Iron sulphur domain-containing protein n=1 Tax=Pelusios castaneus TaxID=367368 RepID=A0A8C8RMS8_9SAUR
GSLDTAVINMGYKRMTICPDGHQILWDKYSNGTVGLRLNSNVWAEWIAVISLAAGAAAVGYLAYTRFLSKDKFCKAMVNLHIQKDNPKVVHSKKFPLCDDSHMKHNDKTGDNVGPLIIKRKEA